jgi:glucose-1-phosphate thymidylyltransferase
MDAIVLAGGYATRLFPITLDMSKPLLPVAGRPMLEYVLDHLERIDEIDRVWVVTNEKFYRDYLEWLKETRYRFAVIPVNDGTSRTTGSSLSPRNRRSQ